MTHDKIGERTVREDNPTTLKDFVLAAYSGLTGNKVNSMLKHGQIAINGAVTSHFNTPLNIGDKVEINFSRPFVKFNNPRVQIIYEDDDIIVINKGYGLLSVDRGAEKKEPTAYNIIKKYLKDINPENKIFIIHRLDKDTSGLMMFAKNIQAKDAMQHNWNNMVLDRRYVAVLEGKLSQNEGEIKSYLGETRQFEVFSSDDPKQGKLAITRFKLLATGNGYSLVEFSLNTGRKNQIRVHASKELNHPIVGDRRYGAQTSPIQRLALHARSLKFAHPRTKKLMQFETNVPEKFQKLIK